MRARVLAAGVYREDRILLCIVLSGVLCWGRSRNLRPVLNVAMSSCTGAASTIPTVILTLSHLRSG